MLAHRLESVGNCVVSKRVLYAYTHHTSLRYVWLLDICYHASVTPMLDWASFGRRQNLAAGHLFGFAYTYCTIFLACGTSTSASLGFAYQIEKKWETTPFGFGVGLDNANKQRFSILIKLLATSLSWRSVSM